MTCMSEAKLAPELRGLSPILMRADADISIDLLNSIEEALQHNSQVIELVARASMDKRLAGQVKLCVREKFARFFEESRLLRHAIDKPFGYPGDFWILEALYDGVPVSESRVGKIIDAWCMQSALPYAVVERKDILRDFLVSAVDRQDSLSILSVASGSAREIRELPRDLPGGHKITLLDTDSRAYNFFVEKGGVACNFVEGNALDFNLNEQFDIVYSFGLFDYLSERLLDSAIRCALKHLAPGGTFVFSLKDVRFYSPVLYDWFCDWRFVPRTESAIERICKKHGLVTRDLKKTKNNAVVVVVCEREC